MDIRNGKNYDLIDSKIEDEFYKNEGINKKKLSLIHLDIRKLKKYNILSNFKKEESIISLNKNYDIKKNKKLNHQLSLSKMSFTKNKNKLTPFQKILKKSYQERKIVEQMKKNNSPIKELKFILKNSDSENMPSLFPNKSNSNLYKTPLKKRIINSKINLYKPLHSSSSEILEEQKIRNKTIFNLFLSNIQKISSEKKIKDNKVSIGTMKFENEGTNNTNSFITNREKISVFNLYFLNSKKINNLKRICD
jgi:hypothetical protein